MAMNIRKMNNGIYGVLVNKRESLVIIHGYVTKISSLYSDASI